MIYDITPPITTDLAVWPGDTQPSRQVLCDMKQGANLTLSTLRTTVHAGAHADAPSHYGRDAATIDERPLDLYLGPCQVIAVNVPRATRITPEMIRSPDGSPGPIVETRSPAPRLLFRTGTLPDPNLWNEDFAALSPELIDMLAGQGIRLVGIDTPSVDLFDSKDLPAHQACLRHDMAILEGLALSEVPPGTYELIALPLKLVGFDASPVRAILRRLLEP